MLLDELVGVIETLKQRIRTHGATLRAYESRTRVALIDPLLVALGWDVSDPALVTPEYVVGGGRADYALHGSESIPAAMVEAKRLGHALNDDERMQMLNYANARGVRYAAVTDGDAWEFYEVFKQAPLEDRRLLNLRIANTPAHELALRLLLLWRPNLAAGQPVAATEPILTVDPPISPNSHQPVVATAQLPTATPVEPGWERLSTVNPKAGDPYPTAIRFPDGVDHQVTSWRQMVHHAIDWLWLQGHLKESDVPVPSSTKRYIVNIIPYHQEGNRFGAEMPVSGTPFVYEGNISSRASVSNAKKLLAYCGVDAAGIILKVG